MTVQMTREGIPIVGGDRDKTKVFPGGTLMAAPPLQSLFPAGVGLDALANWVKMTGVVAQSRDDPNAAFRRASNFASPYIDVGHTIRAMSWFLPTHSEVSDVRTVIQRGAKLQLNDVREFSELKDSEAWRQRMTEYVEVRRVWGPIGLFWALLLDRLASPQTIRSCEHCGRPLKGTRRKRFCGPTDSAKCYRQRRAGDRQRERSR